MTKKTGIFKLAGVVFGGAVSIGKTFMGGGASYVLAALIAFSLLQKVQLDHVKKRRDELKTELTNSKADAVGKAAAINTQNQQAKRGDTLDRSEDDARQKIENEIDSETCVNSPTVTAAFDWVRAFDADPIPDPNNDAANVHLPK